MAVQKGWLFMYIGIPRGRNPTKREDIMGVHSLASLIAVFAVMGCASPEERAWYDRRQAEQMANAIKANCRGYGFKEGTDGFAGCVQSEFQALVAAQSRAPTPAYAPPGGCFGYGGPDCGGAGSTPIPAYQQGTHTYNINGRLVTCTTTGTYTNCF